MTKDMSCVVRKPVFFNKLADKPALMHFLFKSIHSWVLSEERVNFQRCC